MAGGGLGNGNAYATVELKNGFYYYCEYGTHATRERIGNTIVWSDEVRRGASDPYESRSFDITDVALPVPSEVAIDAAAEYGGDPLDLCDVCGEDRGHHDVSERNRLIPCESDGEWEPDCGLPEDGSGRRVEHPSMSSDDWDHYDEYVQDSIIDTGCASQDEGCDFIDGWREYMTEVRAENADESLQCSKCGIIIERDSRQHDHALLTDDGETLTCEDCQHDESPGEEERAQDLRASYADDS